MKYLGSKNRYARQMLPIILKNRKEGQFYIEPFVGGANMIDKVSGNRMGSDLNEYVIALLKEMSKPEFTAPDISEDLFNEIKLNKGNFDKWIVGYAGTQLTFGSTWFGSYRKDSLGKRDYSNEAKSNVNRQSIFLKGVDFSCCSYHELEMPANSIVYCDPPYDTKATKGKYKDNFSHSDFWQWCRDLTIKGYEVFISEYNAPEDFVCIWQTETKQTMNNNVNTSKATEKLFVHKSQFSL